MISIFRVAKITARLTTGLILTRISNSPCTGQGFQDALDDLAEQALQLLSRRWPHATEFRHTILDAVNAVKHQAMQMNIEFSGRTEKLVE